MLLSHDNFEPAVQAYFGRFTFSNEALKLFLSKASRPLRRAYFCHHGVPWVVQKYVIDKDMVEIASDFSEMYYFDDIDYLLQHGSPEIIRMQIAKAPLFKDEQVIKLLHHINSSLFTSYVAKGYFISNKVLKVVIKERCVKAFRAVLSHQYHRFRKLALKNDIAEIRRDYADEVVLAENLQIDVLKDFEPRMVELLLKYSPLWEKAQKFMIANHSDVQWLKIHVSYLYGVAGYRFIAELEPVLFEKLSLKSFDDCLMQFKQKDDVVFIRYASPQAVIKRLKSSWPSDEAQLSAMARGNGEIIDVLIGRFTPEHGMCWQAEVEMVQMCSPDTIKKYVSFHTMCREALELLHKKCLEVFDYYFMVHPY